MTQEPVQDLKVNSAWSAYQSGAKEAALHHANVAWPQTFRPNLLACGPGGHLAALPQAHGNGVVLRSLPLPGAAVEARPLLDHFSFRGDHFAQQHLSKALASHWDEKG